MGLTFSTIQAPFPGMPMWGAKAFGRSYIISYQPTYGYAASWATSTGTEERRLTQPLPGSPFQTFTEARKACDVEHKRGLS
jgi:hypothetical protein